ncbi:MULTISPECIES: hypothetical protein [unclassified Rhodococcus (in: high G+C Gram-positive bacteria)]|uniref:hypothetical protein n=1 Tax=unclassified Rhodococcus (in: high G+C Gram-positive bacteria) TaxID=192944 RepID=UPI00163B5469|nr:MULTISPECIES: hypothetical protein [unclassified Rhodococcus (in: high G+C Gram-positive bacteria)]MBC2637911.1 hypothetical protein [Rhodococcus sp. 3A]MBC2897341.1 hypothetical protein [Rhodococcus sp. 4CII]
MAQPEALVYDAIRTPRRKGKKDGSLHGTKPINLADGLIDAAQERNPSLDPNQIDEAWSDGRFANSVVPVRDRNGAILDRDEVIGPESSVEGLARLNSSYTSVGRDAGFDSVATFGQAIELAHENEG